MKTRNRLSRVIISLMLVLGLILSTQISVLANEAMMAEDERPVTVFVHGEQVIFEGQQPVIINNRTLIPARGVFEKLGFDVDWDPEERQVIITNEDNHMVLTIGSNRFEHNGVRNITLDVAAQIINDRTMIPIRFPVERIGYEVLWDAETRTVNILDSYAAGRMVLETNPFSIGALRRTNHSEQEISDILSKEVLRLINVERAERGLVELRWSEALANIAFEHSQDMSKHNFVELVGSDGATLEQRLRRNGITRYQTVIEAVARGAMNPGLAFEGMSEPDAFYDVLFNPNMRYLGLGVAQFGYFGHGNWTMYFARTR